MIDSEQFARHHFQGRSASAHPTTHRPFQRRAKHDPECRFSNGLISNVISDVGRSEVSNELLGAYGAWSMEQRPAPLTGLESFVIGSVPGVLTPGLAANTRTKPQRATP